MSHRKHLSKRELFRQIQEDSDVEIPATFGSLSKAFHFSHYHRYISFLYIFKCLMIFNIKKQHAAVLDKLNEYLKKNNTRYGNIFNLVNGMFGDFKPCFLSFEKLCEVYERKFRKSLQLERNYVIFVDDMSHQIRDRELYLQQYGFLKYNQKEVVRYLGECQYDRKCLETYPVFVYFKCIIHRFYLANRKIANSSSKWYNNFYFRYFDSSIILDIFDIYQKCHKNRNICNEDLQSFRSIIEKKDTTYPITLSCKRIYHLIEKRSKTLRLQYNDCNLLFNPKHYFKVES